MKKLEASWAGEAPPLLSVSGLGDFYNQVVFAKLQEGEDLDRLHVIAGEQGSCSTNP